MEKLLIIGISGLVGSRFAELERTILKFMELTISMKSQARTYSN